tara:strand:+ start:193 stop:954 length:762 start_codon:yes stop_codon:yes gene_type:complete
MNIFNIKSILRFFILSWIYKKGFFSLFLKYFCFLPFFTYEVNRVEDIIKDRTISKGHIENGKEIIVKIFNFRIIKFNLSKGEILTAEHFYFHRSLEDVKYLLKISKKYLNLDKNSIIFDPACGTGKHLLYITDKYKCKGIGADIYPNAINISKHIEKFSNCNFLLGNSCNKNILLSLSRYNNSKKIDFLFINSWVKHVYKNKDFYVFLDHVKNMKCKIMIIEQKKIDLKNIFKTDKILYQNFKNNTQYVILEL